MRVVARDRYVNGHNGEFLCIKGRFAHPFVNHEERLRTPLVRYKKGGRLVPATWDEAVRFTAQRFQEVKTAHGGGSIGVVGSPRLTNEANWALLRFAREVAGTDKYTATEAFSLVPFFENLSAPIATHRDIRRAKTILLIGGEPEELQPLTGRAVRQAVRNDGAKLVIVNSREIRLKQQAALFVHVRPGSEDAAVLALASPGDADSAARKLGVEADELARASQIVSETAGDVVVMFGGELSAEAQAALAGLPASFGEKEGRRFLFHPLPLFNNSVGVHDLGLMSGALNPLEILDAAGSEVRAMYVAGSFLPAHLEGREDALGRLDFLVVQELFLTETALAADVVLPAASFAEIDGTYTNNGGLVQRVRQSVPPVHQSKPDWAITSMLAQALGTDFGFQMSSSTIFLDMARNVGPYEGLRYPLLKDESKPVQVKHALAGGGDSAGALRNLRDAVSELEEAGDKTEGTPPVGHELFKLGVLTGKVPQFHLLAAGNPEPESVLISPLYQITVDPGLRRASASGD
ncbi:MAG TPA: molybdopterin-dependent oxidoreductase, partial [Pyrinomonadaceae bacterium]|nr:molybdopterin-dependent oxidoreductase [Pyrinomonadaceae bacterium]